MEVSKSDAQILGLGIRHLSKHKCNYCFEILCWDGVEVELIPKLLSYHELKPRDPLIPQNPYARYYPEGSEWCHSPLAIYCMF